MRNLKKVLALLLALTMVLGTVVFAEETVEVVEDVTAVEEVTEETTEEAVVEETTEEETTEEVVEETVETVVTDGTFTDVEEGSAWEEPINLGVALGLFTGYGDGTFVPEGDITRAEFAAIVIRALGLEAQANGAKGSTMFTDVASSHWASGYINLASSQGIINGYGDGTFGPEDNVTYEQAVKMVVVALGYEAAVTAPYPVGYLTIAQENGLTDNVKGTNGVAINRGQVAIMIYNALDVPLMQQTGYGTLVDYTIMDGYNSAYRLTLLSEKFSVVKLQAIVNKAYDIESTKKTDLVEITVLNNYDTKFDDTWYDGATEDVYVGDTDIKSYAGSKVIVYVAYDEIEDEGTAIYVKNDVSAVDELTMFASQIEATTADDGLLTVEYREDLSNKKTQKFVIDADATLYVNGYASDADLEATLDAFYGEVTFSLIDSKNTENDYDTVFVTNYSTLIVDYVNTSAGRVVAKDGNITSIVYNPDNKDYIATLTDVDGNEVDWESLEENDVLSVKKAQGSSITAFECVLVDNVIEGEVDEIFEENTDDVQLSIGGNKYGVNVTVMDNDDIDVEDAGTFYLDILGKIAYFDLDSAASGNYAYIIDAGMTTGLGAKGEIMMYTYEGELVTVKTASNVKYYTYDAEEDKMVVTLDEAEDIIAAIAVGDIITYQLNSSGEISKITVPATDAGATDLKYSNVYASGDLTSYNSNSNAIKVAGKTAYITDATVIMAVDMTTEQTEGAETETEEDDVFVLAPSDDESDYEIIALSALVDDYDDWTDVVILDANDDKEVACIVVNVDSVSLSGDATPIALVKGTSKQKNAAGNSVTAWTMLQGGEAVTLKEAENNSLAEGDVAIGYAVLPKVNVAGDLKEVDLVAKFVNGAITDIAENTEDVEYFSGAITDIKGSRIYYGADEVVLVGAANIYLYDTSYSKTSDQIEVLDDLGELWIDEDGEASTVMNANGKEATSAQVLIREYEGKPADIIIYLEYNVVEEEPAE